MSPISRHSPTPLYEQIKLVLRDQILSGHYPPGSQLPSENNLCAQYSVSRITAVRALHELESEGLIVRVQGKGSIVASHHGSPNRTHIGGHSRIAREDGIRTHSKVIGVEVIEENRDLARLFRMPLNEPPRFMRIRRLRYMDDTPAIIMNSIMIESLGKRMLEFDLDNESFYDLYEKIWGLPVIRNETSLTPIAANEETARLLEVKVGSPHYLFRGFSFLEGDIPIELCLAIFRGNKFTWSTNIYKYRSETTSVGFNVERQLLEAME